MFVRNQITRVIHPEDQNKPAVEQRWIEIRTRMNQGQKAGFWDEISMVNREVGLCSNDHYNLLMLAHNVTGWGGPGTEDVPFSESSIQCLDPNDALVLEVLEVLDTNNRRKESPDPKSETAADSTTSSGDGMTPSMAA